MDRYEILRRAGFSGPRRYFAIIGGMRAGASVAELKAALSHLYCAGVQAEEATLASAAFVVELKHDWLYSQRVDFIKDRPKHIEKNGKRRSRGAVRHG